MSEAAARLGPCRAPIYDSTAGTALNAAVVIDERGVLGAIARRTSCGANEQGARRDVLLRPQRGPITPFDISATPIPVFNTSASKVGVAICYDRHFEGVVKSWQRRERSWYSRRR